MTVHRGLYGRHGQEQRWGPGVDPSLGTLNSSFLEQWFPLLETGDRTFDPVRPSGQDGAVWIRFLDSAWFVCHASMPRWSRDRSIHAWAMVRIPEQTFASTPCLGSVVADVLQGADTDPLDPQVQPASRWASRPVGWPAAPWDKGALPVAAALADPGASPAVDPVSGWRHRSVTLLQGPGWIALQAILLAMHASGSKGKDAASPCAVIPRERSWTKPRAGVIPAGAFVFDHSGPGAGASVTTLAQPVARGVEVSRFIQDFGALQQLLSEIERSRGPGAVEPRAFEAAAASRVPLALVGPDALGRGEWRAWAAERARLAPSQDSLAAEIDALAQRAWGGSQALVGPLTALCAAWAGRAGPDSARVDAALERWLLPPASPPARRL